MIIKRKHILNFICLGISVVTYLIAFILDKNSFNTAMRILFWGLPAVFIVAIYMFEFFYLISFKEGNEGKVTILVFKFLFIIGDVVLAMVSSFILDNWSWILFADMIFSAIGYCLISLFIPRNLNFKPMTYKQKIIEVFRQFGFIFVSLAIEIVSIGFLPFGSFYWCYLMANSLFYDEFKKDGYNDTYWYYGKAKRESSGGYYKTISSKIKDSDGNTIGTLETQGEYVPQKFYDIPEGWRAEIYSSENTQFCIAWVQAFLALPLRIFSFLFSVLALFIPWLYVSVKTPNCEKKPFTREDSAKYDREKRYYETQNVYNDYAFIFLDLLIPKTNN